MSVHTAAAVAMVPQVNGFGTLFVQLRQWHHERSPDSGKLKSLNFKIKIRIYLMYVLVI